MLKKKTRIILLISILVLFVKNLFAGSPNNLEKGDMIYRDLQIGGWVNWHAGIYMYYTNYDPNDDMMHVIGEQLPPVGIRTLYSFKNAATYQGARTLNLTVAQRKGIIETIKTNNYIRKPFVDDPNWTRMIQWTDANGDGKLQDIEIDKIRCDGWTEIVYALNGIQIQGDIINNTNWYNTQVVPGDPYSPTALSPKTQASAMISAVGTPPTIAVFDSQNNSIPDNGSTTDKNVTVKVDDGPNGSGVCHFEVYQGADINGAPLSSFWDLL